MFGTFFNHQQMRRYLIAFGQFFNKLEVHRTDVNGIESQRVLVPLDFSPKERWFTRLLADPDFTVGTEITLPRLAYEMPTLHYDGSRHINTRANLVFPSPDNTELTRMYVGVPYNLNFNLYLLTKLQQDGLQVIEQIVPYFTPDLFFAMVPVPEFGIEDTIPLSLTSVACSDDYEGSFEKRRNILWTLGFTMKVFFYGPKRDSKRITKVDIDLYASTPPFVHPSYLSEEDGTGRLDLESGDFLVNESTPDTALDTQEVAIIEAVADADQIPEPGPNVKATVSVTDFAG
jgi:hypothetical protein